MTPTSHPAGDLEINPDGDRVQLARSVLQSARWAPSGDNTQPWRFRIIDEHRLEVHGFDTRDHCVYDLDGHASHLSLGGLLETISIAARALGHRASSERDPLAPSDRPVFQIVLEPDGNPRLHDHLAEAVPLRSVQRRPMRPGGLTGSQQAELRRALAQGQNVRFAEGLRDRAAMAWLLFRSAKIRLTTPEAYEVHRDIIQWNAQTSVDRVPDAALGVGAPTLMLMRFVMQSWSRVQFFNRFLGGTLLPRLQMDFVPAVMCGAHAAIETGSPLETIDDYVEAGRAMQRFWLTATHLGLQLQPEMTPLIFARYAREGRPFTSAAPAARRAGEINARLEALFGAETVPRIAFLCRVGHGPDIRARSTRLPLEKLMC